MVGEMAWWRWGGEMGWGRWRGTHRQRVGWVKYNGMGVGGGRAGGGRLVVCVNGEGRRVCEMEWGWGVGENGIEGWGDEDWVDGVIGWMVW